MIVNTTLKFVESLRMLVHPIQRRSTWLNVPVAIVSVFVAIVHNVPLANGQEFSDPSTLREIEAEMLTEINFIRSNPVQYAEQVLVPLKATLQRRPKDKAKEYQSARVSLSDHPIDYIEISEGDSLEDAVAVIDEAIEAMKATSTLAELKRNKPLNAAARWFSNDFLQGGTDREPHVDSLDRNPAARIAAFGATKTALADWKKFLAGVDEQRQAKVYVFKNDDNYFLVDLPKQGGYRYRSVPQSFGSFVESHGTETTVPRLNKDGFEINVLIDAESRSLIHGDDRILYPVDMPAYGENIVWGPWSRKLAARGLVCWWILDPGIPHRGHRKTLLEPSMRYCGIGLSWSSKIGLVATLDVTSEPLVSPDGSQVEQ